MDFYHRVTSREYLAKVKENLIALKNITGYLLFVFFFIYCTAHLNMDFDESKIKAPVIVWYTEKHHDGKPLPFLPRSKVFTCASARFGFITCKVLLASQYRGKPEGYIFHASSIDSLPKRRNKTIWAVINSESPNETPAFLHDDIWPLFNYSATFSRLSDVPIIQPWIKYLRQIPSKTYYQSSSKKNAFLKDISPIIYLESNCDTFTDRDNYVQELMNFIPVDSYGSCVYNKEFPRGMGLFGIEHFRNQHNEGLMQFISKYKFMIVIEDCICEDYNTEKLWRAISAGVVPIYFGDPRIKDWLPHNKSVILLQDFATPEDLSKFLYKLLKDDKLYEEYVQHKIDTVATSRRLIKMYCLDFYLPSLELILGELYCQMCEGIHDINTSKVHIASKKHYNCSMPVSALTQNLNPNNSFVKNIEEAKYMFV